MLLDPRCDHCKTALNGDVSLWVDTVRYTYAITCDDCSIDHCHFVLGEHMPMAGSDFQGIQSMAEYYQRQGFNRGGPRLRGFKRGSD